MGLWGFTAEQLRALLQLLDMANALRPEIERALASKDKGPPSKPPRRNKEGSDD